MNDSVKQIILAASVHVFTATGAIFGLLAILAAANGAWERAFLWLGIALIVDGADGPLARRFRVKQVLPRFSGEDLDHIIDYLNYVAIPAFIVARAEIVPASVRLPLAAAIMVVSLFHFADTKSKTDDGYFVGFPAIWNVIALYCFVMAIPPIFAAFIIILCILLTFIPLKWVHPVRVVRLRIVTWALLLIWAAAAISAIFTGFPGGFWERAVFLCVALYLIAIGLMGGTGKTISAT